MAKRSKLEFHPPTSVWVEDPETPKWNELAAHHDAVRVVPGLHLALFFNKYHQMGCFVRFTPVRFACGSLLWAIWNEAFRRSWRENEPKPPFEWFHEVPYALPKALP